MDDSETDSFEKVSANTSMDVQEVQEEELASQEIDYDKYLQDLAKEDEYALFFSCILVSWLDR
jgi:hypothetical protein